MSTTTTVIVLLDIWSKILESNKNAVVLQLDQSAAYDMVDHPILIGKLEILGFDCNAINLMKSYLNNRRQMVEIDGEKSEILNLGSTSTIQGSVLAGLLYLIYTLDFPAYFHTQVNTPHEDIASDNATVITYVDDTNSTIKEKENEELVDTMKVNLKLSEEYTSQNHLALNTAKTKIFAITKSAKIANSLSLPSSDITKPISNSQQINMLGVMVDSNLKNELSCGNRPKIITKSTKSKINVIKKISKGV